MGSENQRNERIVELGNIIPESVRKRINDAYDSSSAFFIGAVSTLIAPPGIVYLLTHNLPNERTTPLYFAVGFIGLLSSGIGGFLACEVNTRNKIKRAGLENPQIMDEILEWADLNNCTNQTLV